jgi:2-phosphosulfolactate phosphatase
MAGSVIIDSYHGGPLPYGSGDVVVAIDVIRATTTCATAVSLGRRCLPVSSLAEAASVSARLLGALVAGEVRGERPEWFELQNSPVALLGRDDIERALVLLSTSGTRLLCASHADTTHVACMRNRSATVRTLLRTMPPRVAIIGAGSRGEFREEDQVCGAQIAAGLIEAGYVPGDESTEVIVERWRGASTDAFANGASAAFLRRTNQVDDLEFILTHDDDLEEALVMVGGEVLNVRR